MIEYQYPEEKTILLHYADALNNVPAKIIIDRGYAKNSDEADQLSAFYWAMVDKAVEDGGAGVPALQAEGIEAWMEYIFHSLNGNMVSNGYTAQWDKE